MATITIEVTQTPEGAYKFEFDERQRPLLTLAMGLGEGALCDSCLTGAAMRYCVSPSREKWLSEFFANAEKLSESIRNEERKLRAAKTDIGCLIKKKLN